MGTTSDFVKLRSTKAPKVGEWNKNYGAALGKARQEGKFIVTAWTNGDVCGNCILAEKAMMTATFKNWMARQDAYFVFQYSGDKDKGAAVRDWIYRGGNINLYPGFRVTLYDAKGKIALDKRFDGKILSGGKTDASRAKVIIANIESLFEKHESKPEDEPAVVDDDGYKVRFNESLTTAQVNKVLDAIDKSDGYCPCQPKGEGTKCHCVDFVKNKDIGEPCICGIYVKMRNLQS